MIINKKTTIYLFFLISLIIIVPTVMAAPGNVSGSYNDTTQTRVNVTNAPPVISAVTLPVSIDLNPGGLRQVNCTVDVYDFNGHQTIKTVNATLWDNLTANMSDPDINVSHYTNTNCIEVSTSGPYNATYECTFNLTYYAFNSTEWICNATALDNSTWNFTDFNWNKTTINPLYALDVTSVIDFGDAYIGEQIIDKTANVTNFGNQPVNISVQGYGTTIGDGLCMVCDISGSIPIEYLDFSSSSGGGKTPMDGTIQNVTGLTIPKIDQVTVNPGTWNQTYWDLEVNPINSPFGLCTGTVIFTAWNS